MMMQIESCAQDVFQNMTFSVSTPDGEMFVSVMEDDYGKPLAIDIHVGKSGASLAAWAHTFARMLTMNLEKGGSINDIISELSSQTSDKSRRLQNGVSVRSGPEGVAYALMLYQREKFKELSMQLGVTPEDFNRGRRFLR